MSSGLNFDEGASRWDRRSKKNGPQSIGKSRGGWNTKIHMVAAQETALTKVQVYDLQVAVKGKYGPVFVGKTWVGKYDKEGKFTATNLDKLIARYFIDFNEEALREQRENHWDGSNEVFLDPIPLVA